MIFFNYSDSVVFNGLWFFILFPSGNPIRNLTLPLPRGKYFDSRFNPKKSWEAFFSKDIEGRTGLFFDLLDKFPEAVFLDLPAHGPEAELKDFRRLLDHPVA